jgi:hypothetical protein
MSGQSSDSSDGETAGEMPQAVHSVACRSRKSSKRRST